MFPLMRNFLLTFIAAICCATTQAESTLSLVTVVEPDTPTGQAVRDFVAELFARIQTPYQLSYRPALRAEYEFKNGSFAGDIGRSTAFANRFPQAIRVDPEYFSLPFYAISYDRSVTGWSDLHGQKIAYLRGIAAVEDQLKTRSSLHPSDSVSACLKMVKARRVDFCILNAGTPPNAEFTQPMLRQSQFAALNTYIWLAPEQTTLAGKLSKALQSMQKDGSLARHQQRFLNPNATPSSKTFSDH